MIQNVEVLTRAAQGEDLRHQHRPAHPVPRLPRAEGGGARAPRARGHRDRARHRDRRSARDGQPARVQPERPRRSTTSPRYRNRAVTDIFEPGSSIKPFVVAAALASGRYDADTHDRRRAVQGRLADHPRPPRPRHASTSATVLARSSNVGDGEDRALARQDADARHAVGPRLRQGHGERLSRRVRRAPAAHAELAADQHRDDGVRLRPVGHAAAARAGLRDDRRLRRCTGRSPSAASTSAPGGRARACTRRWPRDLVGAARGGGDAGRHRRARRRCPAIASPARPAPPGRRFRRLLDGPVPRRCSSASCRRARRASRSSSWSTSRRAPCTTAATSRRRCSRPSTSGALRLMSVAPDDLCARRRPSTHARTSAP